MQEYYWSLLIEPNWIQAAVWVIDQETKKAKVYSTSPPSRWEKDEDLPNVADTSLSLAIQDLPEDAPEPSKTVFGVSSSWVLKGQIKKEYLDKIRGICSKLSLEPVGFVVLPEAIAHFIKSEEGSPLSAVVIGLGQELLDIAVYRLGNLVGTTSVTRSVSVVDDLIEGLVRLKTGEPFPSRFLIYNGREGDLEEEKQILIAADWTGNLQEKVQFLHTPKVEIIDSDSKLFSVCLAGASEIEGVVSLEVEKRQEPEEEGEKKEQEKEKIESQALGPEDMGFTVGKDITQEQQRREVDQTMATPPVVKKPSFFKKALSSVVLKKLKSFPFSIQRGMTGKRFFVFGGIGFVAIIILALSAWWFLPKAEVTIYVAPKNIEQKEILFVDPRVNGANFEERLLPGNVLETSVSADKTRSTTGSKRVGEKAKGKVLIQNGTSSNIRLAAETKILGPNNLSFTLDSSASVSAAVSPSSPGTASVSVTAEEIGAEYNLAKEQTFQVANYPKSEVDGIAEEDFLGGSSREISVVSSEDKDILERDLSEELLDLGKKQIREQVSEEKIFIEEAIEKTVSARDFNHKLGDEAPTLKLSMSLDMAGLIVLRSDLQKLAKGILEDQVAEGFVLKEEQIEAEFYLNEKSENGIWQLDVVFKANLLPEIRPEEITRAIKGKYLPLAEDHLSTISGFTRVEIRLKPSLPGKLRTLPRINRNISIEVVAEE